MSLSADSDRKPGLVSLNEQCGLSLGEGSVCAKRPGRHPGELLSRGRVIGYKYRSLPADSNRRPGLVCLDNKSDSHPGEVAAGAGDQVDDHESFFDMALKGGLGCPMSPTYLESQGCHLIPLYYLLSWSSAYSHCFSTGPVS